ncbi:MAG: single-stranded DNA-binding protein [Clostridia bacterium]|nr:single-stranded DNA-binding protein [Clostridia bacterium]
MNKVIFIGNLTRDPESGTTQSGVQYCRFSIAVNRRFSRDNETTADFFNITCWRGLAESCAKNLQKGRKVCVVGSLQTSQYTANDGSKRTSYDVIADEVEFLPSGAGRADGDNTQGTENNGYGSNNGGRNSGGLTPVDEDDLPF